MPDFLTHTLSRRAAAAAALTLAGSATLPRAIGAQDSTPESTPVDGEWSFTDDKGVTVTLPSRPENLVIDVNAAAPLWDFGIRPTALFGWNVLADGSFGDAGGNIDPEGIAIVGDVNERIRLEDLVAQDPDLVITVAWDLEDLTAYWSINAELVDDVTAIAPIVAISTTGSADANTERFAELAALLGADLETEELAQARTDYDAAIQRLQDVAAAKSDLSVLFVAPTAETAWVANAPDWADLNLYQTLGVNIVKPDAEDGAFWEEISHEQALKYPADVMFVSTRAEALSPEEIKASPTWSLHPAVKADQVFGWNQDFIQSYQGMAEALNGVSDAIDASEKQI